MTGKKRFKSNEKHRYIVGMYELYFPKTFEVRLSRLNTSVLANLRPVTALCWLGGLNLVPCIAVSKIQSTSRRPRLRDCSSRPSLKYRAHVYPAWRGTNARAQNTLPHRTETKTTLNLVDSSIFKTARGEPYFCFVIDILFTWRNVLISRKYLWNSIRPTTSPYNRPMVHEERKNCPSSCTFHDQSRFVIPLVHLSLHCACTYE